MGARRTLPDWRRAGLTLGAALSILFGCWCLGLALKPALPGLCHGANSHAMLPA